MGLEGTERQETGEDCRMRSFMICTADQIRKDKEDGACSMYGGREKRIHGGKGGT